MWFFPRVEGTASIRAEPRLFIPAFARRIETGLLPGSSSRRWRYAVTHRGNDGLAFRATNWLTALNVGLNEVELSVSADGHVRYSIRYPRWACYVLLLCGSLGIILTTFLLTYDIRGYINRHVESRVPGLSTEQNIAIAWAIALFWGFVWPWILIAFHKRPLRRLLERLIADVDDASSEPTGTAE
jgi:hypothetical protein